MAKSFRIKKLPSWFAIGALVGGAILVIGLLSFSGMFALWALLPVAFLALAFSVMYEGQVYIDNIRAAWDKLFKRDHLKQLQAKQFLRETVAENLEIPGCPDFYKDYDRQLQLLQLFENKKLSGANQKKKERIERTLDAMEAWFTTQLFRTDGEYASNYEKELNAWLDGCLLIKSFKIENRDFVVVDSDHESDYLLSTCNDSCLHLQGDVAPGFVYIKNKLFYVVNNDKSEEVILDEDGQRYLQTLLSNDNQKFTLTDEQLQNFIPHLKTLISPKMTNIYVFDPDKKVVIYFDEYGNKKQFIELSEDDAKDVSSGFEDQKRLRLSKDYLGLTGDKSRQAALFQRRSRGFLAVKWLSVLAGFCMGIGTTYLLIEAFTVIAIFAALPAVFWPALIVPLAILSGAAYGFLTYNAFTDIIVNDLFLKWVHTVRADFKKGFTSQTLFRALGVATLVALSVVLTVCTAGTWWTVFKNSAPLFKWMSKIPSLVFEILIPSVVAGSALMFNIENTLHTVAFLDQNLRLFVRSLFSLPTNIYQGLKFIYAKENFLQWINPFRLIIVFVEKPLRILFFFAHLVGIAVSSDRFPGIPEILSALIGIVCEGFEDAHYFADSAHEACDSVQHRLDDRLDPEGHDHEGDLPSRVLKICFHWAHELAFRWDFYLSQSNTGTDRTVLKWEQAKGKFGLDGDEDVSLPHDKNSYPSEAWMVVESSQRIAEEVSRLNGTYFTPSIKDEKIAALKSIDANLQQSTNKQVVQEHLENPSYKKQRIWTPTLFQQPTLTSECLEDLLDIVSMHDDVVAPG